MTVEFAQRLRRDMRGMSQRQLASRVGVDHSTISRLLGGKRNATPEVAEGLMRGLRTLPTDRARFLLLAAGHSKAVVYEAVFQEEF